MLLKAISPSLSDFYLHCYTMMHSKIVHNSRDLGKDDTIDAKKI